MTDLDKLIEAVEGGHLLYGDLMFYCLGGNTELSMNAYHGSLDAAKSLHQALLPDAMWSMSPMGKATILDKSFNPIAESGYVGSEARAWLLAILKAYRSQL